MKRRNFKRTLAGILALTMTLPICDIPLLRQLGETALVARAAQSSVSIIKQPKNQTVALGEKAVFTVEAANAVSYQWYYKKTATGSWQKLTTWKGCKTASLRAMNRIL